MAREGVPSAFVPIELMAGTTSRSYVSCSCKDPEDHCGVAEVI